MGHHARSGAARLGARARRPAPGRRRRRLLGDSVERRRRRPGARRPDRRRGRGHPRGPRGCRCPAAPQTISGGDLTPLVDSWPRRRRRWSRRSATQPHYVARRPRPAQQSRPRDPAPARAALALIDALNATGADGGRLRPHRQRPRRRQCAEPAAARVRAALPGDDAGAGRRRPARRAARRLPLRPGRGARSARSPSARRRWSRTAPA